MRRFILSFILVLAFVLRIIWLDKYPSGFTPDEASFGYDAYSILKTGKDQWGKPFPLVLESFGDFKSPLYAYLTIPSVAIFGLNRLAVRLPNAILGTLAILMTYLLANKLFNRKVGIFSAFLLAISPWHVMLSRGAFEANLTTFFLPLGIYLLLRGNFILAGVSLGLNLFTYHTAKFVTPLVLISFVFFYRKELRDLLIEKKRILILGILTFLVFAGLTVYTFLQGAAVRVAERSITQGATEASFQEKMNSSKILGGFAARLFHNKYTVIGKRFFQNYLTYFSPQFLFSDGPKEGTYGMIPGRGVLFWFTVPFFWGLFRLFHKEKYRREILFLMFWILVSPVPASLATGVGFSANRVAAVIPAIDIALAIGGVILLQLLQKKKILLYGFYSAIAIFFIFFLEDYFVQSPYKISKSMLYGNLEAAEWVRDNVPSGDEVIVDKSLSEPHIYFAFSSKINPRLYQKSSAGWDYKKFGILWVDQIPEYNLGAYKFKDIKPEDLKKEVVLVGRPDDFPSTITPSKIINYPNGNPAVLVVNNKK